MPDEGDETQMNETGRPAAVAQLGPEYDAFLFAPVGAERNGMALSMLSALARLNIDPWQEAAELTRMPRDAANRRLTSLIVALPDAPSTGSQVGMVADRLIALLPRRDLVSIASRATFSGPISVPNFPSVARRIAITLLLMASVLCVQRAMVNLKPRADADITQAHASNPTVSPITPSGPGN